jgi:hypothetical protein
MNQDLLSAYRYHRRLGHIADVALMSARRDVAAGVKRYPSDGNIIGAPFGTKLRWIEDPTAAGLRFVGFADELAPRSVQHVGWLTDEECLDNSTLRGAVYQLPARDGRPVYVPAYREGSCDGQQWRDTATGRVDTFGGPAAVAFGELICGDRGGLGDEYASFQENDDVRDAARRADRIAELQAESEREYNEAWQAGSRFAELAETIAADRRASLALLREMKPERQRAADRPAICAALRERLESLLEDIREARERRAELLNDCPSRLAGAFNEGAGEAVIRA